MKNKIKSLLKRASERRVACCIKSLQIRRFEMCNIIKYYMSTKESKEAGPSVLHHFKNGHKSKWFRLWVPRILHYYNVEKIVEVSQLAVLIVHPSHRLMDFVLTPLPFILKILISSSAHPIISLIYLYYSSPFYVHFKI